MQRDRVGSVEATNRMQRKIESTCNGGGDTGWLPWKPRLEALPRLIEGNRQARSPLSISTKDISFRKISKTSNF